MSLKYRFVIGLFIVFPVLVGAQTTFSVIAVKGHVQASGYGAIKPGMVLKSDTDIMRPVPDSRVLLVGDNSRTYEIKSGKEPNTTPQKCITIATEPKGKTVTDKSTLKSMMHGLNFHVIGDVLKIKSPEAKYLSDGDHFLFVSYRYNGKTITQKLLVNNGEIYFVKNKIFTYAGRPINIGLVNKITLYYYDGASKKSETIASFGLEFINKVQMMKEETYLISAYKKAGISDKSVIVTKSLQYFHKAYGAFDEEQLNLLINSVVTL